MPTPIPKKILARQHEIVADFLREIDRHLADLEVGRATEMLEIRDLADRLHIHPTHLSNTLKLVTGHAPCYFFEARILELAQRLLRDSPAPVADIAARLTYDPSNFTKFFKRFAGLTPKQYREAEWARQRQEAETVTI
ncbi:AraC family transcriptional regulator [Hymenobacter sp. 15J16-1T3B]|uniref:helix-turn-helix transcriptional regulator n=1 Tax=Hymenobacter sp. 15J16-1T3B TaxID=2886941 RepID=UPI001D12CC9D|nr:AraC family transcriptional regulator [Hymenobacter sp. 15J16-1T3B]MCC3160594.1 AraC family transcriptional regulator [Hymenobacter sp. 15J16-1T3B]